MNVEKVIIVHNDPVVLRVTDLEGCDYHYVIVNFTPIYGYPYVIIDYDTQTKIHLFVPLPSGLPILLGLETQ
jgi:hypothetical protein